MPLFFPARREMERGGGATTMTASSWTALLFPTPRATNEGKTPPTSRRDAVDRVVSAEALDSALRASRSGARTIESFG